jgi:putative membrane protein
MMYWGDGVSGWGVLFMMLGNLLFWGLIIAGLVMLVRSFGRPDQTSSSRQQGPTPRQVLAERYARGEIDDEEYAHRLQVLDANQGS